MKTIEIFQIFHAKYNRLTTTKTRTNDKRFNLKIIGTHFRLTADHIRDVYYYVQILNTRYIMKIAQWNRIFLWMDLKCSNKDRHLSLCIKTFQICVSYLFLRALRRITIRWCHEFIYRPFLSNSVRYLWCLGNNNSEIIFIFYKRLILLRVLQAS